MKLTSLSLAAAAIGLCFAACSNDNTSEIDPKNNQGGSTDPASLTITIGQPSTRAADDTNAIAAEVNFVTADVFIYEDNTLRTHERLAKSDFDDKGSNMWQTKKTIATTTGMKEIYVGLNMPLQLGKDMAAVGNKSALELLGNTDTYNNTLDSSTDGFVMFSTEGVSEDMLPEPTVNTVKIPVARLVAKITVEKGSSLNLSLKEGELDNLEFAMRNSNKLFYPFQKKDAADIVYDPNWLPGEYNVNDFNQATASDYVAVNASGTPVKSMNVKYAPENTSRDYLTRETTYASVRATFVPKEFSDDEGNLTAYNGPAVSFWVVKLDETGETYYFDNVADATAFATDKGGVSDEYKGGLCYYNLFLNPTGKFNTLRNTYYQLRIASITGLGNPNPWDEGDTDKPVTEPAVVEILVDIQPWDLVSDDYDLF